LLEEIQAVQLPQLVRVEETCSDHRQQIYMKAFKSKPTQALPREEWDFYNVDEQEAQLAFFYEYARDSEMVKTEVAKMRAARPEPHIWPYYPREQPLIEVLAWLAQQESFPQKPWFVLKAKTTRQIRRKRAETQELEAQIKEGRHEFIKLPPGSRISLPTKLPQDSVETIEWMCAGIRGSNVALRPHVSFEQVWMGDTKAVRAWHERQARTFLFPPDCIIQPKPEASFLEFGIDWRLTDVEIIGMVSSLIRTSRPHQFKKHAKTPLAQRGLAEMIPFRTTSALQWLGVLRRRNSVKSWREFFDVYGNNVVVQTDKAVMKSREVSDLARPREEDCRKAKLILNWFNNGTALRKEDFE
jgi:hypothetical protein